MTRLSTQEAEERFAEALGRVTGEGERILLCEGERGVAALISAGDLELFERLLDLEEERLDLEAVREAREEPGPNITLEQFARDNDLL